MEQQKYRYRITAGSNVVMTEHEAVLEW